MRIIKKIKSFINLFGIEVGKYYPENYSWLKEENINTVIDIGANTGQFALKVAKILPHAKIFSFEPVEECYRNLINNTSKLNIEVFKYALGEKDYSTEINVSAHSPSSSLLEMDHNHKELFSYSARTCKETITVKRLDSVLNPDKIIKNYLVKLDVQGFESNVIKGGIKIISEAKIILIEINYYQLYKNQASFHDIYSALSRIDFRFAGNLNQTINRKRGDIIYSDAIFIKS